MLFFALKRKSWYLLNWEDDGREVKEYWVIRNDGKHWSRYIQNLDFMFRPALTWTTTSTSYFGIRHADAGFLFDVKGSSCFPRDEDHYLLLGLLSSKQLNAFLACLNPTTEFQAGNIATIPVTSIIFSPSFKIQVDTVVGSVLDVEFVVLHGQSKFVAIHEQANDDVVQFNRFGEADGLAGEPFDTGA
jgi:hypothetical protein